MRRALWFAIKFVALTAPLTWLWIAGGRELYASYFVPIADAIYDLLGVEGARGYSWRERYINYVPFAALVLLTPSLGARRRAVGLAAGLLAIFASHVLFNGIAQHGAEDFATMPTALSIASDSLPFLLWAIIARDFVRDVARRVIAPPRSSEGP
jgi:hypothetical protein